MQNRTISGYTLQHPLGTGGMAEVWYAENKIGKKAAVKMLLPKLCQDENVVSRFLTEAKVMVELNHPNIRQVYDYGDIEGTPAIVMEYLEGDDLKARMKRGQRFTDEELKRWWNQLVDALNYTHKKGVVHRDIKPGNIFVDREGNIKLLDFGIAKVRESISSTQTGQKLGTLMYMSPEQVKDSKHVDYRTDIYSLAVTFVHLITGKKPYNSDTTSDFEISEQIVYKPLDLSGLPDNWRVFLAPYLNKEPEQRPALRHFENAGASAYNAVHEEEGTMVDDAPAKPTPQMAEPKPEPKPEPSEKPKSKKGLWIGLGVATVAAVALVLFLKPKHEPTNSDAQAYETRTNLYPAVKEGVYGYIDSTGYFVIEPTFAEAYPFSEGMARILVNINLVTEKHGFINEDGKTVISPQFDYAEDFSEGLALVGVGDWNSRKYGYIEKNGNYVIPAQYDDAGSFHEGLALVAVNGKYGYIDKTGSFVIMPQFEDYSCFGYEFSEGLALAVRDGKFGYIDHAGSFVIEPVFDEASPFSEGLALVGTEDEDGCRVFGFIDKEGRYSINPTFRNGDRGVFSEGLSRMRVCNSELCKEGFIDKTGSFVIEPKFDAVGCFSEGLAAVEVNGKWGYIDKTGGYVIEPTFVGDDGSAFSNGLASINQGVMYIDKTGRVVYEGTFPVRNEPVDDEMVEITRYDDYIDECSIDDYIIPEEESGNDEEVFQIVEEMPSFPGGEQKLMEYVANNIKYPSEAREKEIQGRVFIGFVVEKDGSVSNVKVLRGIGGGCDEEAMRVVKSLPKWNPGKQRFKPVRVSYMLPVNFKLN